MHCPAPVLSSVMGGAPQSFPFQEIRTPGSPTVRRAELNEVLAHRTLLHSATVNIHALYAVVGLPFPHSLRLYIACYTMLFQSFSFLTA